MTVMSTLQKRVVLLGWLTYASYYLGRVNLATALPAMQAELGWQPEQTGVFASATLWTYALGQIFNGWLGERIQARWMVFFGIAGSTVVNLIMAFTTSYPALIGLALVNGFLQAMGWGPILRTISHVLSADQRERVAGVMGASYIIGNTLTWVITSLLLSSGHWQSVFIIPPLLMLVIGLLWLRFCPPLHSTQTVATPTQSVHLLSTIKQLWGFLLTALIAGALINGALLFAPTFIAQTLPLDQASLTAIVFPLFGLLGTIWLNNLILRRAKGSNLRRIVILLGLAAAARGLAFILPSSTLTAVLLLGAMGITSYALTNMLLSAVPLLYSHLGTSMIAGLMDSTHSIGGALGSLMVGILLPMGWSSVFLMWLLLPLLAIVLVIATSPDRRQMRTMP
jgi:sugar phosphate permease